MATEQQRTFAAKLNSDLDLYVAMYFAWIDRLSADAPGRAAASEVAKARIAAAIAKMRTFTVEQQLNLMADDFRMLTFKVGDQASQEAATGRLVAGLVRRIETGKL